MWEQDAGPVREHKSGLHVADMVGIFSQNHKHHVPFWSNSTLLLEDTFSKTMPLVWTLQILA